MVARRGPDDPLAVGKEERAGVVATIVDSADVAAVDIERIDMIGIIALALGRADDAVPVGREVEFHRGSDVGYAMHGEFVSCVVHVRTDLKARDIISTLRSNRTAANKIDLESGQQHQTKTGGFACACGGTLHPRRPPSFTSGLAARQPRFVAGPPGYGIVLPQRLL
jgi:hypothetical protein